VLDYIVGVIGEMPPERRKEAVTSAISQWFDDNATRYADESKPADGTEAAGQAGTLHLIPEPLRGLPLTGCR